MEMKVSLSKCPCRQWQMLWATQKRNVVRTFSTNGGRKKQYAATSTGRCSNAEPNWSRHSASATPELTRVASDCQASSLVALGTVVQLTLLACPVHIPSGSGVHCPYFSVRDDKMIKSVGGCSLWSLFRFCLSVPFWLASLCCGSPQSAFYFPLLIFVISYLFPIFFLFFLLKLGKASAAPHADQKFDFVQSCLE